MNFTALIYSMKNDVSKVLDSDEDTDQGFISRSYFESDGFIAYSNE